MFLVGWLNLITHPLLCPIITLELNTSVPLTMDCMVIDWSMLVIVNVNGDP